MGPVRPLHLDVRDVRSSEPSAGVRWPRAWWGLEFLGNLYGVDTGIAVESLDEELSRVRLDPGVVLNERYIGQYAMAGEDAIAFLWCWALERPDDYWLSTAETLEFLPAEE